MVKLFVFVWICFLSFGIFIFGGATEEIESFSSFELTQIKAVKPGEILTAKGGLMDFERGISSETCFLVAHPLEKVLDRVTFWDQTPYSDLGIYIQGKIVAEGSPDFSKLSFIPSLRPVSKFIDKTGDTRPQESPLHLSIAEATQVAAKQGTLSVTTANQLWSSILNRRFLAYQTGGLKGLPAYNACKISVQVGAEVDAILAEQPGVSKQFQELFQKLKERPNEGEHYWQMQNVDGTAVLVLGTIYKNKLSNGGVQVVDLQWYVTSGYYVAFTCYELHPLEVGKTAATLVWRGDYTSISMKQLRKGVERMFSVNVMIQEVKKSIRFFLEDLGKR